MALRDLLKQSRKSSRLQALIDLAFAIHAELVIIRKLLEKLTGNDAEVVRLRQAIAGATKDLDETQTNIDKIGL